ncbi:MAG: hypothetical protein M3253_05080 [Chloroflexota bacterium]|nr:hypothetical protein [Chloroflexota bacterium]
MERLKRLGILIALLTTGVVIIGLIHGFQALISQPAAMFISILLGIVMVAIILKVALVPERRFTGWARSVTGRNARWLFLVLLLVWGGFMAFLASLGLGPQSMGAPALVGLFIGVFLFMGFTWAVIGE